MLLLQNKLIFSVLHPTSCKNSLPFILILLSDNFSASQNHSLRETLVLSKEKNICTFSRAVAVVDICTREATRQKDWLSIYLAMWIV